MSEKDSPLLEFHYESSRPLTTLWTLIAGDRLRILAASLLFLLKHSPVWIMPIVFAKVIGIIRVPEAHSIRELWIYIGIALFSIVQNVPTCILYVRSSSRVSRRLETRLRQAIVRRLQHLSMSFHSKQETGRLQSKVMRDVESVQGLASFLIEHALNGGVTILVALSVTIAKDPRALLLYVLMVPAAITVQRAMRRRMRESHRNHRQSVERMASRVHEMLSMIPITRAHGLEEHEISEVSDELNQVRESGYRMDMTNATFGALSWVSLQIPQFLFLGALATLAWKTGRPHVEDIILFWGFFQMIMGSVQMILGMFPTLTRGFESIRSIGEVLECPDIEQNQGRRKLERVTGAFRFDAVTFTYGNDLAPAVRDFTLDVRAGECVAFVGPSGSGKSTLMSLVIGFRRPTSGRISLDGSDMQTLDLRTYRRHLAVIPQETFLFNATLAENITYGLPDVSGERLKDAARAANLEEFIDGLPMGFDTIIGEHGTQLSGGQRQRVAIARALIRDPRVIILDEATSALDVVSEKLVQDAIDRLIKGRTTFIVAHRLSTIRHAHRIVVLKEGLCVESGTHEELMARQGEFHRLKTLQF